MDNLFQIESKTFPVQMIDKPPHASFIYRADGELIYTCPHCKKMIGDYDDCDVMGAEPGCLFCPFCNGEFHG